MDPDQIMSELGDIKGSVGELSGQVGDLKKGMSDLCEFKDTLNKVAEQFKSYAKNRKDLPDRMRKVEDRCTELEGGFRSHCKLNDEESLKLHKMWDSYIFWRNAQAIGAGLSTIASTIVILLVLFHEKLGLVITMT